MALLIVHPQTGRQAGRQAEATGRGMALTLAVMESWSMLKGVHSLGWGIYAFVKVRVVSITQGGRRCEAWMVL